MITITLSLLAAIGVFLLFLLAVSVLFLGTLATTIMGVIFLLWIGTLIYYLFFRKEENLPHQNYSIDQGKEIE